MSCSCCNHEKDNYQKTCVEMVPIFSNLNHEEIMEIAKVTSQREFKKGEIIFLSGEMWEKLYVIHRGKVKISRISDSGKEQIIRILGPGDFMGELSLFARTPSNNNAEALENTTVCEIEGKKIKDLMIKSPTIAVKILEELSQRLEQAENLVESIGLYDVERRIAAGLLNMASEGDVIMLSMSKKDFAAHMGMSQETLSRKLSAFQDMGWIKLQGQRKIVILDRESLVEATGLQE